MGRDEITDIADKFFNRREDRDRVREIINRCVRKKYEYEKLRDRLMDLVSDANHLSKLLTAITKAFPQFRKRNRFEENKGSSDRRDRDRDRDQDRNDRSGRDDRHRSKDEDRSKERHRSTLTRNDDENKQSSTITEDMLRAKELMYKASQEIEARKRQLGLIAQDPGYESPVMPQGKNAALAREEAQLYVAVSMDEKKARIDDLKARLAANRAAKSIQSKLPTKVLDATPAPQPVPEAPKPKPEKKDDAILEFLDPRIKAKPAERKRRAFTFHEKGEFEKLANKQRAMAKLEKLQAEISQAAKSTGISSAVKLAMVTPAAPVGSNADTIPDCEWWDTVVLEAYTYDSIPDVNDEDRFINTISELVEHPIKLRAPTDPLVPHYLTAYLTKRERKKLRRQNRKEMQKERTEKIRLGLEKAPEAKVKISNLMRVLGSDAVQDPTKMEAQVRKQMAERLRKHEEANAERKLTNEQKAAKKTKKISEDTSLALNVAVYRIKSLLHPSKKFKVETNARQLQMTGVILLHKQINVVVVEGGPKQQKFYKNLMLNRIKWEDEIIGQKKDADKDTPGERNSCQLIWEGQVKKRNFRDLSVVTATIEKQARDLFDRHAVPQYWDLAYSTSVLLDDQDPVPV